ncbi:MAG: hypothetical protein JWM14_134 [Chitinophagaceae bacterium]|nr:hypothetical protein [Chitinophagaceae bacterium]
MSKNINTHAELRKLISKVVDQTYYDSEEDWQTVEQLIQRDEFKFLLGHLGGIAYIFNYKTGLYEYMSSNVQSELGYKPQQFMGEPGAHFIYTLIAEEQVAPFTGAIMQDILIYLSTHSTPETGRDYRFTCSLKLKNIANEYKWFIIDTNIIQADKKGFPVRSLVTCTNIHAYKKDDTLHYTVLKKDQDGIYQTVHQGDANKNQEVNELSSRETEIMKLIVNGYKSKQIAEKLFISPYTVLTHRRNILQKTQCKGTAQLTKFAFVKGFI